MAFLELESLCFSDFIFFFKTNPKKYFLGFVSTNLEGQKKNNYFFFLKKFLLSYYKLDKKFNECIFYQTFLLSFNLQKY